jgi:hypothetical protein
VLGAVDQDGDTQQLLDAHRLGLVGRGIAPRGALTGGFFRAKPVRVMRRVSGYAIIHL